MTWRGWVRPRLINFCNGCRATADRFTDNRPSAFSIISSPDRSFVRSSPSPPSNALVGFTFISSRTSSSTCSPTQSRRRSVVVDRFAFTALKRDGRPRCRDRPFDETLREELKRMEHFFPASVLCLTWLEELSMKVDFLYRFVSTAEYSFLLRDRVKVPLKFHTDYLTVILENSSKTINRSF